jgi:DNA-binding LytR/AlgR family response regulator
MPRKSPAIRAVIVDDEKPARDRVRRMLSAHEDIEIVGEASNVAGAVALLDEKSPDLCFLDVQMPGGDGFDVLRRAKKIPRVIFTTAYDQYAVRAFEVNSLDYLLKPFDKARLSAALERAREAMAREAATSKQAAGDAPAPPPDSQAILRLLEEIRAGLPGPAESPAPSTDDGAEEDADTAEGAAQRGLPPAEGPGVSAGRLTRIAGKRGGKIVLLDPADILWFEAEVTLVFAKAKEGRFLVGKTLTELEEQLDPKVFFRSHRRYLVNLSHTGEIHPADEGNYRIMMKDEAHSSVPLSRRQARKLRGLIPW